MTFELRPYFLVVFGKGSTVHSLNLASQSRLSLDNGFLHTVLDAFQSDLWLKLKILLFFQVSNIVGPGVLAAAVLSIRNVTYLDVATGLFGYFLSQNLEDITGVSHSPMHYFYEVFRASIPLALGWNPHTPI